MKPAQQSGLRGPVFEDLYQKRKRHRRQRRLVFISLHIFTRFTSSIIPVAINRGGELPGAENVA
jgi:hypothetical protein